jgi:hypothetical protein
MAARQMAKFGRAVVKGYFCTDLGGTLCRWAVSVSSACGSSKTSESRQAPDTTGVEGLRTTPFLGWLLIRMRSG